jgi:hypothetical protein
MKVEDLVKEVIVIIISDFISKQYGSDIYEIGTFNKLEIYDDGYIYVEYNLDFIDESVQTHDSISISRDVYKSTLRNYNLENIL